ncbi:MAG: ATP-binding cassette domain-containing protein [Pseudomonadota bacterium]
MNAMARTNLIDHLGWHRLEPEDAFTYDRILEAGEVGTLGHGALARRETELLLALLMTLEWRLDTRALAGALPHFPDRFGVNEIRSTLMHLGYQSRIRDVSGLTIRCLDRPSLVVDKRGALWIAPGRAGQQPALVAPGDQGWVSRTPLNREKFSLIEFDPDAKDVEGANFSWSRESLGRFLPELRFVLLTSFVSSCLAVLAAFGIMAIFDNVLPSRNLETLTWIGVGFVCIFMLEYALRQIGGAAIARMSARIEYVFGSMLFGKVLKLPEVLLAGSPIAAQLTRLRQFQSLRELPGSPLAQAVYDLPLALMTFVAITVIAWPLAFVLGCMLCILAISAFLLARPLHRQTRRMSAAQSAAFRTLQQVVSDRAQISRLGMAEAWKTRVDQVVRRLAIERHRHARIQGWLNAIVGISLPLATLAMVGTGALLAIAGSLTTGQLVATTILSWRMFAVFRQIAMQITRFWDTSDTLAQIDKLKTLPEQPDPGVQAANEALWKAPLVARNASYRFPKSVAPIVMNATFEIPFGSFVAITGPSGSGKSTLLRMLSGLTAPQAGGIYLDNLNLNQLPRAERTSGIAYVSQNPFLFYGSVAQNLRFSDPLASDEKMRNVLHEVGLGPWLARLPEGLETRVDPSRNGGLLRSDIRTNFAIARALLSEPSILLLDEPLGVLDPGLEAHLTAALENRQGRVTRVIVTHRPSIARRADLVIQIDQGRVQVGRPSGEKEIQAAS